MSRIGKQEIKVPGQVKVAISGQGVHVEGPKGKLDVKIHDSIAVSKENDAIVVNRKNEEREARNLHGLTRTLISNMVKGVSDGFTRDLEISGVGYRAEVKGNSLHMALGYSHPVVYALPAGIKAVVDDKRTKITLSGVDKQLLGVTAAKIRSFRKPEPYGGKGIRYADEVIQRKEGKSAGK